MSDYQAVGLGLLLGSVAVGGIATLIAVMGSKMFGWLWWRMKPPFILLVICWVISLGLTIVGIYFLAKPQSSHSKNARIRLERQATLA
jgi:hypothetical protein